MFVDAPLPRAAGHESGEDDAQDPDGSSAVDATLSHRPDLTGRACREIAADFAEIYEYDWDRLARAKPTPACVRVAREGAQPPEGFRRTSFSEVFED